MRRAVIRDGNCLCLGVIDPSVGSLRSQVTWYSPIPPLSVQPPPYQYAKQPRGSWSRGCYSLLLDQEARETPARRSTDASTPTSLHAWYEIPRLVEKSAATVTNASSSSATPSTCSK